MSKETSRDPSFHSWLVSALAATLLALLWAGCGGGSDTETAANAEPLTKSQFVKQANAICKEGLKQKDQAVQQALTKAAKTGQESTRSDLEGVVSEVVLPRFEETTSELGELSPPEKDASTVDSILGEFEAALKETEEDPSKMLNSNPFLPASKAAANYGLTACNF